MRRSTAVATAATTPQKKSLLSRSHPQVGQLAADLLISTWQAREPAVARRVGWLHEAALLPAVGASDAAPGTLAMALELYQLADGLFLLQQRAPAAPGMQRVYAERLGAWVAETGFSEVGARRVGHETAATVAADWPAAHTA